MKKFSRYILTFGVITGWALLTIDAMAGVNTTYAESFYTPDAAPIMALPLQEIFSGEKTHLLKVLLGEKIENSVEDTDISVENQSESAGDSTGVVTESAENEPVSDQQVQEQGEEIPTDGSAGDEVSAEAALENAMTVDEQAATENATAVDGQAAPEEVPVADEQAQAAPEEAEPEVVNYVLAEVDDDYFNDALFIGDSRTVGLSEYCEPLRDRATFYAKVSLTVYDFSKKAFVEVPIVQEEPESPEGDITSGAETTASPEGTEGDITAGAEATENPENAENPETPVDVQLEDLPMETVTIEEALGRQQFAKIYIMLGLNELGGGTTESFRDIYANIINRIRELQPDAQIYIQGIMHVTQKKSISDKVFKNEVINERNIALSQLADYTHVFYLDMNEATDDENGALGEDLSFDNIHLKAKSYTLWYDYLKTHAYVPEQNVN